MADMEERDESFNEDCKKEGDGRLDYQNLLNHNKNVEKKLETALQALKKTERQLEKSQSYNEELRLQIESLSKELHGYRTAAQRMKHAESQTTEADISEEYGDKPFPVWGPGDNSLQTPESGAGGVGMSIAESLKAAAQEEVMKEAGFTYDSTSGHYYDSNSGYYYDTTRSLYYDPSTTSYFYYDEKEQTYKFHSYAYDYSQSTQQTTQPSADAAVSSQSNAATSQPTKSSGKNPHRHKEKAKVKVADNARDSGVDCLTQALNNLEIQNYRRNALEVSQSYPPCIRVIVQASDVIDAGMFFLVTCPGGTIGRDKDPRHAIQIKDINISKFHADIKYDNDNLCYTVEDRGSQNGTFLNDLRISESKEKSAAIPLSHGDVLKVASTQMLLHIHPGTETCDECEPGQVQAALRAQQTVYNDHVVLTKAEKQKQVREQFKSIKKKYGLANCAYVDNTAALNNPDYTDKASERRKFVGSEHPSHQKRNEQPASVHRPITAENKGHRMLAKMGWKEGSGLGKDSAGRSEPVSVDYRVNQTAGLGSQSNVGLSLDNVQSASRAQRAVKTRERFEKLQKSEAHQNLGLPSVLTPSKSTGASPLPQTIGTDGGGGGDQKSESGSEVSGTPKNSSKFQMQWVQGQTQNPT